MDVIDSQQLKSYSQGDADWEREFVQVFIDQSEEQIQELRNACLEDDGKAWRNAAHFLKGCAGNIGATFFYSACEQAQLMEVSSASAKEKQLRRVEKTYEQAKAHLTERYQL